MNQRFKLGLAVLVAAFGGMVGLSALLAEPEPKKDPPKPDAKAEAKPDAKAEAAAPVKPKALSENVKKALAYLVNQQHANGGWGQGGGWRLAKEGGGGRVEGGEVADPPDVASTCMATLAFLRAGYSPKEGEHAKVIAKAIEFIETHIEKADKDSLYVTDVRDTQVQSKIGPYVDTFLAAMVMAEVKGKMPDRKTEDRLVAALDKTITKIEKNQKADGTFEGNNGWASIISQGLACKGLNRARQLGANVKQETLERFEKNAVASFDGSRGAFRSGEGSSSPDSRAVSGRASGPATTPGTSAGKTTAPATGGSDAGVPLYTAGAQLAGLQETTKSNKEVAKKAEEIIKSKDAPKEQKEQAKRDLDRIAQTEMVREDATKAVLGQLGNQQFVAGFGSNGGEEFLSYMNIAETLVAKGGKEWEEFDKKMAENLSRVQNQDGSWSGHHCITGRTFCTSSALLVLLADRSPTAAGSAAKMKEESNKPKDGK